MAAGGLAAHADEKPLYSDSNADKDKIHIVSDSLMTSGSENLAEFIGDVRATQGNTVITSDRLKIYYKEGALSDDQAASGESNVEKIVAIGNVRIRLEDRLGVAEQAEYFAASGKIILTGENSKVSSGNNFVMGQKIILFRDDDRMIVERSADQRVEAVIYSGETARE